MTTMTNQKTIWVVGKETNCGNLYLIQDKENQAITPNLEFATQFTRYDGTKVPVKRNPGFRAIPYTVTTITLMEKAWSLPKLK